MTSTKQAKLQSGLLVVSVPLGLLLWPAIEVDATHYLAHFVETYILPLFFVGVGLELRHEFTDGYFKVKSKILVPLIAALLGVVFPALLFIAIAGPLGGAWSIPTATDITLGLAVLAFASTGLSKVLRARFLALATIDDVIGLAILLVVFSAQLNPLQILLTTLALVAFSLSQRIPGKLGYISLVALAAALFFSAGSGLQTSLVGVALGLLVSKAKFFSWLTPLNGWIVLPFFGFLVSASAGSYLAGGLATSVLVAVCLRPLGKFLGILIGGSLFSRVLGLGWDLKPWGAIGLLGGIGFTVSFLLARVSLGEIPMMFSSAVVGTLIATVVSMLAFAIYATVTGRRVRLNEKSL